MKSLFSLTFLLIILPVAASAQSIPTAAENVQQSPSSAAKITNRDVIELLQAGMTPAEIIHRIKLSTSEFDTSDAAVNALKEAAVPPSIIEFMLHGETPGAQKTPAEIVVAAGTQLDVEARYTVSSLDVRSGDLISFRVLVPIKVNGIVIIDKGALVTARVMEAKRGGHWGHAGTLSWVMQDVLAIDGTRIPLRAGGNSGSDNRDQDKKNKADVRSGNRVKGTSHGGEVLTKTIIPSAIFPPLAPLALIQGFKRGENAVLPEGKRFFAFVDTDSKIVVRPD